jgi:hypothetical protein
MSEQKQSDFDLLDLAPKSKSPVFFNEDQSLEILDDSFLLAHSSEGPVHILVSPDVPHRIHEVSDGLSRFLGFKKGELLHSTIRMLSGPNTNAQHLKALVEKAIGSCTTKDEPCEAAISLYKKDGEEFKRILRGRPASFQGRPACSLELDLKDKSAPQQSNHSSDCPPHGGKHIDPARLLISASPPHLILSATPSFLRASGFGQHQLIGTSIRVLSGPDTDHAVLRALFLPAAAAPPRALILYRRDGEAFCGTARQVSAAAGGSCAIAIDAAGDLLPSPPPPQPPPPAATTARHARAGWPSATSDPLSDDGGGGVDAWVLLHVRAAQRAGRAAARRGADRRSPPPLGGGGA